MRLIFMGTPDFSVPALEALIGAGHDIAAVYAQPARPAGRGRKPRPGAVQARAAALGLPLRQPTDFRDPATRADFAALDAEAAVVVAYGLILPGPVLEAPRRGAFNIHASLLPRWRGAAPIQRAIMAGDSETGVCVMRMDRGLDTGPVLARAATPIGPRDTAGSLHDRLAAMGARLMVEALPGIESGALAAIPQGETGVTCAAKIDKREARVDWTRPAAELDRRIRGLSPFPGAWGAIDGARVKFLLSGLAPGGGGGGRPGEVLSAGDGVLEVACGDGALRLLRLQRAGRGAMDAATFLRGFPLQPGTLLT